MGIFNIDDVEKTDYTTKFTCYDNMIKFEKTFSTSLGETLTLQQVVNELTRITGVEFTGSLPAYTVKKLDGFSCREVLSYVASICGGNAVITRNGKFTIKSLAEVNKSIDGNNYITYTKEEIKYKIGQVSCQVDENNILSKGSLGTDSMELQFENPWVNATILTDIYNKLNGLSYLGYSMKWQGDLSLDPYDVITITDKKGVVRKEPILSNKITYTGGLTSEIGAKGETKNKNSFSSSGSTTNKVNRAVMELAVINKALIDKANIRDLEAVSIRTQTLEAKTAKIEEAIIDVAHIKDLNAINASIENLIAEDARITNLISTKANITDLTATNIKFNVGTGGTLDLQTLLSKFVTGENGQFLNLTTDNVTISNAVIKDIIAKNISVEDLKAGKISTNKFTVASDDGGITIVGPTMQFKDKNNKVRIQMGQDTQGNFNFILRGEDGTTTLIDHTGIKEKAIADDLIKSNMVAENAIGEKQINYSSLITGLNKNDNTSLILASKIAIDLTGQSLDVAFNSLKTTVDNTEIGGRNYIRDYKFKSEDIWKKSRSEAKIDITNGYGYLTGTTGNPFLYQDLEPGLIKKGDVLTLQYEVKFEGVAPNTGTNSFLVRTQLTGYSDSNSMVQDIGVFGKHESDGLYLEEGWQKVVKTITITSNAVFEFARFRLYARNFTGKIYFRNVKLERGNKATDLSEAPEDNNEKIESNTTSIKAIQGNIQTLIKDTTIEKGGQSFKLKDEYSKLEQTVSGINTTVASHTTSISAIQGTANSALANANTANSKIDGLQVGGRNLLLATDFNKETISNIKSKYYYNYTDVHNLKMGTYVGGQNEENKYLIGKKYLASVIDDISEAKASNITQVSFNPKFEGNNEYITLKPNTDYVLSYYAYKGGNAKSYSWTVWCYDDDGGNRVRLDNASFPAGSTYLGAFEYREHKFRTNDRKYYQIRMYHNLDLTKTGNSLIYLMFLKLEEGNKATSWTPAIEDINSSIDSVNTKVTTVEDKYTSLEQSLNGFKTTVSSTYSTKTELSNVDGKVTSLTNRVSTAESSITQLDEKIDLNVSSIKKIVQEGNNNLVPNSNWFKGYSGWKLSADYKGNYAYGVSSYVKLEDKRIIRLGNSGNNTITTIYADSPKFPVSPGEKITYGAFGAVTSNVTMQIYLLFTDNIKDITEDNSYMSGYTSINFADNTTYTKKNNTTTVPTGATRAFIRVRVTKIDTSINTESSGLFSSLMVRKGEEVFEWCPSQGDSYTYIDEQTANLQVNINSITSRVSSTESNISTINGNVSSLQSRMSSAESKITSSAIINTVQATINNAKNEAINSANANTANKLQSYATKTEVTTTAENVIYKFSASGGYNLLKNSAFANKQIDNWWVWGGVSRWATESYYKEVGDMYIANPNTNNPGGLWQSEIPIKPNTKYTLSVTCYKEGNVKGGWFGLEYQSSINSDSITYQNIELTFDDQRHSYTFTTPNNSNIKYAKVGFRHEGSITTGGGHLIKINKPCLVEGEVSVWSPNPFEVKDGSTIIDANGVKIYNGALTVLNNAGQIVLQGDSNGDLTFKGKLQPNDYQLRLFGNDCKIDGSANAIRMQLTSQKYCAMDSEGGFRIFNQYSNNGTRYTSVMMTSEGHVSIYNDRTRIKLLSEQNERPVIQCRNSGDNAYGDFHGADFLNRSTIKDKTNVETIEELDFSKILLENNIFKYNLKTDVENILEKFGLDAEYNLDEVIGSSADGRLGFILEELTEEAKAVLSPGNMESISIYSMCSILWKMCQQYHKRIEILEAKVN